MIGQVTFSDVARLREPSTPGSRVKRLVQLAGSSTGLAVPLAEYPVKGRATAGVQSVLIDRPAKSPAGEVLSSPVQSPTGKVGMFTDRGGVYEMTERDNPLLRQPRTRERSSPSARGKRPEAKFYGRWNKSS